MDPLGFAAASVAFVASYNTLQADFVYDDTRAILQNDDLLATAPLSNLFTNDFWGTPLSHSGSHKSYRPLCSLTFKLNALWSGLHPQSFHLVNVLLHSLATYLFVAFAKTTLHGRRSRSSVFLSAMIFALHPIHTEAVAGIVGRADILAAIFFLLALLAFKKHQKTKAQNDKYLAFTIVCATCAMFCKEQGITVLGVCCVLECVKAKKGQKSKRSLGMLIVSIVGLLALRGQLMGFNPPRFAKADNPASASDSVIIRGLTLAFLPAFNFWLALCPTQLSFDWSMDAIPLIKSWSDPRNAISAFFYTSILLFVISNKKVTSTMTSLSVMVLSFLPATNLLFYVGFVVAERVLYIPSIGLCLLLGHSLAKFVARGTGVRKIASICALAILLASFGIQTWKRNRDWKDEESLYRAGVPINPAKALGNLGNVFTQKGKLTEAEAAFKQALKHRSNMADTHYNLGVLLQRQNRLNEALQWYKNAIHYRPKLVLAHLNLGLTYAALGSKEKALALLLGIEAIDDDGLKDPKTHLTTQVTALYNAGKLMLELGRASEAVTLLRKAENRAKAVNYQAQGILNVLGEAFQALNKTSEAELSFRAALEAKPDHIPAYLTYGKLLAKNKTRHSEAEAWFSKANRTAPNDPSVHLHYGLFLMDSERNLEAAGEFAKAAALKPDDYESVFNAGVAYRQAGRNTEAEIFYRNAVKLKPEDPSAHMNLGAMLHLVGKLSEAEDHYLKALRLRPHDQATIINIQRLHRVMAAKGMPIKKEMSTEN